MSRVVVVERIFEEPPNVEELQAREDEAGWCLDQHDVRGLYSYVGRDGRRMVCVYQAPDAESVRIAQRTAALPFERIWTATSILDHMGAPRPAIADHKVAVVVERTFPEPMTIEAMFRNAVEGTWCFEANDIDVLDSFLPPSGEYSICVFAGPDAESVRKSSRTLGIPFERAWPADLFAPTAD